PSHRFQGTALRAFVTGKKVPRGHPSCRSGKEPPMRCPSQSMNRPRSFFFSSHERDGPLRGACVLEIPRSFSLTSRTIFAPPQVVPIQSGRVREIRLLVVAETIPYEEAPTHAELPK